jgi:hypothetical protein
MLVKNSQGPGKAEGNLVSDSTKLRTRSENGKSSIAYYWREGLLISISRNHEGRFKIRLLNAGLFHHNAFEGVVVKHTDTVTHNPTTTPAVSMQHELA